MRELRLSLRNNSGAYGYSVMITCCLAMLSSYNGTPKTDEVFLFVLGAVVSFALIETIATRAFRTPLRGDEPSHVVALGSSLNLFSIALAIGVTALVGAIAPGWVSWCAGSFLASVVYLIATGVEMAMARKIEEARNLD